MSLITSIRARQADLIRQNSVSITITRITRTDDGAGGFDESSSTIAAQSFRLYNKNGRVLNLSEGGWHSQRITKMIAAYDANVQKESAQYLDKFTYNGIVYKITDVKPVTAGGSVVFKECTLEEIT